MPEKEAGRYGDQAFTQMVSYLVSLHRLVAHKTFTVRAYLLFIDVRKSGFCSADQRFGT